MQVAALGTWLLTAAWGSWVLSRWAARAGLGGYLEVWRRMPGRILYGHILLAVAGLLAWIWALLFDAAWARWVALAMLALVALLGWTRFVQWLPRYGRHARWRSVAGSPAEKEFPYGAVLVHGMWAAATVVLVVVAIIESS